MATKRKLKPLVAGDFKRPLVCDMAVEGFGDFTYGRMALFACSGCNKLEVIEVAGARRHVGCLCKACVAKAKMPEIVSCAATYVHYRDLRDVGYVSEEWDAVHAQYTADIAAATVLADRQYMSIAELALTQPIELHGFEPMGKTSPEHDTLHIWSYDQEHETHIAHRTMEAWADRYKRSHKSLG